ncbi:MAG: MucR family transcriptional regulator [Bdellovibrionales bacterium]|jgi:predicted transcriptional regulator|nr:MucR family transcriptional regulator [Bdellovibrionales bacterium]
MSTDSKNPKPDLLQHTAHIVAAYVSRHDVHDLPGLICQVHKTLAGIEMETHLAPVQNTAGAKQPAVPVKKSVMPDYIICLEDGKKLKMLKRYLKSAYGMSPEQYREKWNLPPDYPMVAPNYAQKRSNLAKESGLGVNRRK